MVFFRFIIVEWFELKIYGETVENHFEDTTVHAIELNREKFKKALIDIIQPACIGC